MSPFVFCYVSRWKSTILLSVADSFLFFFIKLIQCKEKTIGYKGNVLKQNNINSKIVSNDVRHQEEGLGTSSDSQVQRPFGVSIID